ncbi:hypothetical protein Pcinc_022422 [Petrolisthes cinctipes]|uniref:Serine aminopeptidase S33 domain-containing protein n=1 Tax=Petrolisthes cinctipes TaxID=88211 RepID=A0AAE1FE78_PETCI|nr:hypothetical protein Pcinc_022422 [Petrolisthes cinctipes]
MMMEWSSLVMYLQDDNSKMIVGLTLGAGLLAYYLLEAVKRPVLACRDGSWRGFLESRLGILQERYWPTPWCYEARFQTILASVLRARLPDVPYIREVLELKDGGLVSLDWLVADADNKTIGKHIGRKQGNETDCNINNKKQETNDQTKNGVRSGEEEEKVEQEEERCEDGAQTQNKNIVVVLPGLTGSSQSEYVKGLVLTLQQEGLTCVVLNNRGIGGVRLVTTRTYCAANSDDLEEALDHLGQTHTNAALFIIGISLGGMITGNYLATRERKAAGRVVAAAVVSAPWNMVDGLKGMERPGLNLLLNWYLASCLCELVESLSYRLAGRNHKWDLDYVMKSRTMREFDTRFTAHQFGFVDAEDYYRASSLHTRFNRISVPLLCLHAADDPFQPVPVLPTEAAEKSSHVAMVVTARGGHIGFMDGVIPRLVYYSDRLLAQLVVAVFSNPQLMARVKEEAETYRSTLVAEEVLETSM